MNVKVRVMISSEKTRKVRKKGKFSFTVWGNVLAIIPSSAGFASVWCVRDVVLIDAD